MKKIIVAILTLFTLSVTYASAIIIASSIILGVIGFGSAVLLGGLDVFCLSCDIFIVKPEDYVK